MNGNGNGWAKILTVIVAALGLVFAVVTGVAGLARDTPTRAEMHTADRELREDMRDDLKEIKGIVQSNHNFLLDILMKDGGDRRGEGN